MKKFLLVVLIVMVLAMNLYGFVEEYMTEKPEEFDHIKETTYEVYIEQR